MGRKPAASRKERVRGVTESAARLKKELIVMQGRLKSLMETQEATNQELQSSNEEMHSLEQELQTANEELIRATDDLANVFANTDSALVLVDRNLRLYRFTPQAQKLCGILSNDIGRSIEEFPQFNWLAKRITSELQEFETEFADDQSGYFKCKVLPYRTASNKVNGAVIKIYKIVRESQSARGITSQIS